MNKSCFLCVGIDLCQLHWLCFCFLQWTIAIHTWIRVFAFVPHGRDVVVVQGPLKPRVISNRGEIVAEAALAKFESVHSYDCYTCLLHSGIRLEIQTMGIVTTRRSNLRFQPNIS